MASQHQEMQLYDRQTRRLYINEDERTRVLAVLPSRDRQTRLLCELLVFTGCRVSEILSLRSASVERSDGLIAVFTLKKRGVLHVRQIPIPDQLASEVHAFSLSRNLGTNGRLFPMHRMTAWRRIKMIMKEAGISGPQATPKGLRHGYGVHAIQSGIPLNLLQRWMGHTDISTTAIYANALGPEEREIATRMW